MHHQQQPCDIADGVDDARMRKDGRDIDVPVICAKPATTNGFSIVSYGYKVVCDFSVRATVCNATICVCVCLCVFVGMLNYRNDIHQPINIAERLHVFTMCVVLTYILSKMPSIW